MKSRFSILHVNIQGFSRSSRAELVARIRLMKEKPTVLCLNETWLDYSVKVVMVEGYKLISRRDRRDGRKCGGVAVFALVEKAGSMTELFKSEVSERLWILVHSDLGPYLIGVWYRPPEPGEVESIKELRKEWNDLSRDAIGTIIVGDINVHHKTWLRRSARNSAEGEELHKFALDAGMQQLVRGATRNQYLLDLVISDVEGLRCEVLSKIADHALVLARMNLPVPDRKFTNVW